MEKEHINGDLVYKLFSFCSYQGYWNQGRIFPFLEFTLSNLDLYHCYGLKSHPKFIC